LQRRFTLAKIPSILQTSTALKRYLNAARRAGLVQLASAMVLERRARFHAPIEETRIFLLRRLVFMTVYQIA
jgi:hypothetical protein